MQAEQNRKDTEKLVLADLAKILLNHFPEEQHVINKAAERMLDENPNGEEKNCYNASTFLFCFFGRSCFSITVYVHTCPFCVSSVWCP